MDIAMSSPPDLATLKIDDFAPHLDAIFEMQSPAGIVPLRLAKAEALGQARRAGGAFSLLFIAPTGPWLPQSMYPIAHPTLGTLNIFLVPTGPASDGNGYQAVFA
jgi:hypothetical protein